MRRFFACAALAVFGLGSTCASAYTIDVGTNVGGLDSVVRHGAFPGGGPHLDQWLKDYFGYDVTVGGASNNVPGTPTNEDPDVFAFALAGNPAYFLVKNSTHVALVQNLSSLAYGVLDKAFLNSKGFNFGDPLTISFVRNVTGVPEPGSLVLLGTGLFGLALARRRRQQRG